MDLVKSSITQNAARLSCYLNGGRAARDAQIICVGRASTFGIRTEEQLRLERQHGHFIIKL